MPQLFSLVLIGAECTGKTTLARALSEELAVPWSPEYVRQYVDTVKRPLTAEDLLPIGLGQLAAEDAARHEAHQLVIHDTNLLSSIIYAKHYFQQSLAQINRAFARRSYSLYALCHPDLPWQADPGQREGPETRSLLHHKFALELQSRKLPTLDLSGALDQRIQLVRRAVLPLL
ncbi:MAG: AAA family ATPase [Puniceicoccaceae bacterium]